MSLSARVKLLGQLFTHVAPLPSCGVLTVLLSSFVLFGVQTCLGASVLHSGLLLRLLTSPLQHRTSAQLLLCAAALLLLGGGLERGVGTVRFLSLFLLLSSTTGLLCSLLHLLLQEDAHAQGLLPAALACVALSSARTRMPRSFLCGLSLPSMALPWVLLLLSTALVPHSVLPCNITAVLVGWMLGRGWFSPLELSESRACVLERMAPLRLLRRVSGGLFVPASTEERRETLLPRINPTPGSYPVQAYAPPASTNTYESYEGWPSSAAALSVPTAPNNPHGPSHAHSHSCSHSHG